MGIRPRGLGLRLKSRHVQPAKLGSGGARWPFVVVAFPLSGLLTEGIAVVASAAAADSSSTSSTILEEDGFLGRRGVMRWMARVSMGERLRVRDRRWPGVSSELLSSSCRVCDAALRFLAAERVTGPCEMSSSCSDGSGDGEMTRGLAGTRRRVDMMPGNAGSAGQASAPTSMRLREAKLATQAV